MIRTDEKIAVIGVGRLGSALAKALHKNNYSIVALIDQNLSQANKIKALVKPRISSNNIFELDDVDIIFITVPDDEIISIVSDLKFYYERQRNAKFIFHTSGVLTSDVFDPLRKYQVAGASFHPIQTFSGQKDDWRKFENSYFGVEGDVEAVEKASQIIKILKGHWITIAKELKSLYHLTCTIASNYMVSLMILVVELFKKMNLSEQETLKILIPLISSTLINLQNHGIEGAVTGPISRGDIGTIKKHLEILSEEFPVYKTIYQQLGRILLNLKSVHDKISYPKYEDIMKILTEQGA